ncbi:MAG: flagellar basal body rod C-terminal domain-containing protein, partial [Pacificimonas sp.]
STDSRGNPEYREFEGGIGVRVAGISRGYDQFLTGDVRAASARAADTSTRADWSARIETALGTRDNGVSAGLTDFLGSAELLAAAPSNRPLRAGFLAAAHDLAASFRETAARLEAIDSGVAGSLQQTLTGINNALVSLEDINRQLAATPEGTSASTVLLDRRDAALDELSADIPIRTELLPQGRVRVRLDTPAGEELVAPGNRSALALGDPGANGLPTLLIDANFSPRAIAVPDGARVGGLFGALADVRTASANIDTLAVDAATVLNDQHQLGADLSGAPGQPLFSDRSGGALASAADMIAVDLSPEDVATADALLPDGITPTPAGYEDNRNLMALSTLAETLAPRIADFRGDAAIATASARDRADIADLSRGDAEAARANALGVNLDEEAADLIRYQQSYDAAARIIATARDTFDTLLNLR